MDFEKVTPKINLPDGGVVAYDVCETWVALAEVEGEVYAVGDLCTHRGCSLGKGTLEGTTLTCSCHGSQFDVKTGAVLRGPATEPLPSYRVKIDDRGTVMVEI
jgi:3-phenylpropionate/trans-cinnamate dioxygenase ferredoxin subunit